MSHTITLWQPRMLLRIALRTCLLAVCGKLGMDPAAAQWVSTALLLDDMGAMVLDLDRDGLLDREEAFLGTSPQREDTDGDGFTDAEEVFLGSNPIGAGSTCARVADLEPLPRPVVATPLVQAESCAFAAEISGAAEASEADASRMLVVHESGTQARTLRLVSGPSDCTADGFYAFQNGILLCPRACSEVIGNPAARLHARLACFDAGTCGNRRPDAGETCDDGNRVDGDGCDSQCRRELD